MAQRRILSTNYNMCTQKVSTMPLTQEKHLENSFTNNNDHSYLHKKFKKKASTIEPRQLVVDETLAADKFLKRTALEIEKTNEVQDGQNIFRGDNNVQTIFNIESDRLSNVNKNSDVTGQTSFTDEFFNKTENLENHFSKETQNGGLGGRYICPYCKLSCAKPSVLQKHIRAHTNERPYPCVPCGFAFKTKSNLYKHRRSRTHALRLQGGDVATSINEDDLSGGSESDTSQPQTSISDAGSEVSVFRTENFRPNEFSSPELVSDRITPPTTSLSVDSKSRTLYKPKFRAAFYQESDKEKAKKNISPNADFLTEHISKIISDNEAIVDVIEIPLQKMYGKLKPDRQFLYDNTEIKTESTPLNLTVGSTESENTFRKRSHSESFSQTDQKHPLNPEGSIIKDLLLKTKANGVLATNGDLDGPLYICPVCPISYRSADNLEIHRKYYCKGNLSNNSVINTSQKEVKSSRPENIFVRSNSINVRFPETQPTFIKVNFQSKSPTERSKPDNLIIIKPDTNDVIAPLPSPGPLLGNTRLVDTRISSEFAKNSQTEGFKIKNTSSPKRRLDCRSESYSPRLSENSSPRSNSDLYSHSKIRCIETSSASYRSLDEMSQQMRHNSTSLQMFGGEVKIVDHLGSTTTLRIEPSKNQLSPILIHQNLSPSKLVNDAEASNVVVRSGLHSGGIIVHNPPTPKEMVGTPQPQTPRITISTKPGLPSANVPILHDLNHFQFPPLSAITAFNPLTLPPLSPSSPNGATTIFHGGKLIPHVPGIPGPNSSNIFIASQVHPKTMSNDTRKVNLETFQERTYNKSPPINNIQVNKGAIAPKQDSIRNSRSPNNIKSSHIEPSKSSVSNSDIIKQFPTIPTIRVKNVDETHTKSIPSNITKLQSRQEGSLKRNSEGLPKTPTFVRESINYPISKLKTTEKHLISSVSKINDNKSDTEIRNFNFENLITKAEIYNNQMPSSSEVQKNTNAQETPATSSHNERSETSYFQKSTATKSGGDDRKPKFLRPSTLPLKPGTFTPKRHHGITPNANTLPLVSPETPRPAKAYGQLYLNGNAYTYLGLKCSTKVFYCTINRLQPTYVPNQHFLSMYSNWQLLSELTPDPLGLSASSAMSLYDSRHRPQNVAVSVIKQDLILTHSSQWNRTLKEHKQSLLSIDARMDDNKLQLSDNILTPKKELAGGFESNEEYTYVRGRGRGRYVCSECGIRCKKPSMLKKHIRTHTDVRPYTCKHCAFSFKTKGNLTKHMKSKAHYKKCCELGINPNEGNEIEGGELAQCSGETDEDTDTDGDEGNEGETESSDTEVGKSRLPEHEAARCLLSLGGSRPATSATPGLITSARPTTYPYAPTGVETTPSDIKVVQLDNFSVDSRDTDNEPMDLSKSDVKATSNIPEIPTAREFSVLASLASNTAKLPQHQNQWSNGEPMLHTYLTERALLDSKIKQSQLTTSSIKSRKMEMERNIFSENLNKNDCTETTYSISEAVIVSSVQNIETSSKLIMTSENNDISRSSPAALSNISIMTNEITESEVKRPQSLNSNPEFVFTDLIVKHPRINHMNAFDVAKQLENATNNISNSNLEDKTKIDEIQISETEVIKLPPKDHDPVARKVVVGAGGVAYKVTKGKDFDGPSYSQGRLMEDGRRVCDFCNKSFTKPSQLRLHLNIHYMERPFRCSACAVSFRTRGHLQKHERSGSHHNKVSMTSTFGAATSLNPRPFRCSDCNIAFRIHGHLAKHLRSKMHVMRLECLFKLPFGTFTEIERAGVSLTDIDTTDCASSLASLQCLARKLHEKDPTKLEYRDPNETPPTAVSTGRESSEEEDNTMSTEKTFIDSERDSELKNSDLSESQDIKHKSVM